MSAQLARIPTSRHRDRGVDGAGGAVGAPSEISPTRGNGASSPRAVSTSATLSRSRATRREKSSSVRSPASCSASASAMERSRNSRWSLRYQRASSSGACSPSLDTVGSVTVLGPSGGNDGDLLALVSVSVLAPVTQVGELTGTTHEEHGNDDHRTGGHGNRQDPDQLEA